MKEESKSMPLRRLVVNSTKINKTRMSRSSNGLTLTFEERRENITELDSSKSTDFRPD